MRAGDSHGLRLLRARNALHKDTRGITRRRSGTRYATSTNAQEIPRPGCAGPCPARAGVDRRRRADAGRYRESVVCCRPGGARRGVAGGDPPGRAGAPPRVDTPSANRPRSGQACRERPGTPRVCACVRPPSVTGAETRSERGQGTRVAYPVPKRPAQVHATGTHRGLTEGRSRPQIDEQGAFPRPVRRRRVLEGYPFGDT